jgi:serine/threonine protein kinase/nitrite reductase/ring-hydroxylating ferredoxin subunit
MQISSPDQLVGQNIGAYRVERLLGRGQLNAVYLAYHPTQNSPAALTTFILPETFSFETRRRFLERFQQVVAKLTTLQQPHILPVYDYGEFVGYPYLVTPYMTKGSLADILKRRGRLHYADVLDILQQVVAGLAYAHRKGIFHGALKPSNIVLNDQQQMLVAGFGLKQILQMRGIEQDKRPYGHLFSIAGTLLAPAEYTAPEVVQDQPGDARTDIYSLGVILFELLSGRTPFTGTNPLEVAMMHVQQPVLSLRTYCPDIPLALAAVVNQALDRDPARRFQQVDELAEAFAQASPEKGTNDTMRAVGSTEYQETPPVGYVFGNWQFLPPIITDKVATVKPTSQQTTKQEPARMAPRAQVPPTFVPSSKEPVASAFQSAPEPVATTKSRQEALYDLWTLPPQSSQPPRRLDSAQRNTNATKRGPTSNQRSRPFDGRKARGNERVTRRKAVALLATGGAIAAGITFALYLTGNIPNQQMQNNAANLQKNAAMNFTNPADGKASVLVHLADGTFVAYDRACTHKGIYVAYDPAQQLLVCPAHGATFDPARDGTVVQEVPNEPPLKPLPKVAVHVNADGMIMSG